LHSAGCGGLEEMKESLDGRKVLFGVLRLSFGEERTGAISIGISKCVLVHWVGPQVGAVKRGIWNAKLQCVAVHVASSCAVSFKREAHSLRDLLIEDIVMQLRRLTVLDGVRGSSGIAGSRITVEAYFAGLKIEAQRTIAVKQSTVVAAKRQDVPDLRTAVAAVRETSGAFNWVLCGCKGLSKSADHLTF